MTAVVVRPAGAGGVIYASGTENSGMSLFVQDDHLVFDYNCFGDHHVVVSERPLPSGPSVLGVRFRRLGRDGQATLTVDGVDDGTVAIPFVMVMMSSVGPSVGYDHGSPVSDRYSGAFPFEGTLTRVDVALVHASPTPEEADAEAESEARAAMARQ
jgi:arylsulfatase